MTHDDGRSLPVARPERCQQLSLCLVVDRREDVVEQHQVTASRQPTSQRDALPLTPREHDATLTHEGVQSLRERRKVGTERGLPGGVFRHAGLRTRRDVVRNGLREQEG